MTIAGMERRKVKKTTAAFAMVAESDISYYNSRKLGFGGSRVPGVSISTTFRATVLSFGVEPMFE
jgi:hypothetical protein